MVEKVIKLLEELQQDHILEKIKESSPEEISTFVMQVEKLEENYPGGIAEYIRRAKKLLENSKNNVNPYTEFIPSVPLGVNLNIGDDEFNKYEEIGSELLGDVGFILVAGGLGERLGYPGIKIGIPFVLAYKITYIQYYIEFLKAYEERASKKLGKNVNIPLCIMTSDDTHAATVELLSSNQNFGLSDLTIVKQEKVPALLDNDCKMALKDNKLEIDTKPHGHGDVHTLVYQNKVIEKWIQEGKKYVLFFQDTNSLTFRAVPSLVGVSFEKKLVVNTMSIPRKPGDAMGAICCLTDSNSKSITLNVEYNQLDSLLKEKYNKDGDIANSTGNSHFPGNTNVLLFEINSYFSTLQSTKGLMPEFVNPKYADSSKTKFKSPTRLECMMQDYPLLLTQNEPVGFTSFPVWFCFACCKNSLDDSILRLKKGLSAESAFSVEQNVFDFNKRILSMFEKLEIIDDGEDIIALSDAEIKFGPKIFLHPSFGVTLKEIIEKFTVKLSISSRATLVIEGSEARINTDLNVKGITKVINSKIEVNKAHLKYVALSKDEGEVYEQIRGFKAVESESI